jgi:hypothetical protein
MPAGGYQKPSSPAAVSGPGALARRTDGGPSQPVRTPTGLPYGLAGQLQAGQQVQPLPGPAGPGTSSSATSGPTPSPGVGAPGMGALFSTPTDAPGEPITAGAMTGPGPAPAHLFQDDPDLLLRQLYAQFPNEDLRALLEGRDL